MEARYKFSFPLVLALLSLLFFAAISINLFPNLRGPSDWQWGYSPSLNIRIILPIIFSTLIFLLFNRIQKRKKISIRYIFLFVFLGFIFALSLLFASRSGIPVLIHRILNPSISGYFTASLGYSSIPLFLSSFNTDVLKFTMYAGFHPPFATLIFIIFNEVSKLISPLFSFVNSLNPAHTDVEIIWRKLTDAQRLTALYSPFLIILTSILTIIPIFLTGRLLYGVKSALRACVLFLFIPSILMFSPINDVFMPLISTLALYFFVIALKRSDNFFALISAVFVSVGLYFHLAFITLIPFFFLFYIFYMRNQKKKLNPKFMSFFTLGFLIIPALLFILFNFNSVEAFKLMLRVNENWRPYWTFVFYDLYDFFIFLGIPISLTIFYQIYFYIKTGDIKKILKMDSILLSILIVLFTLDVMGTVRGETARIWTLFIPFFILPVANFLTNDLKVSDKAFSMVLLLQILQVLIFQTFIVTIY